VLLDVLEHPLAALVVEVPPRDAEQSSVIRHHCAAELRDAVLEINQVLALLVRRDVVEVDVLVAPLEVVDHPLVRQLLLQDENVLEEVNDALLHVEMVELSYHNLLVFQILFILIYQCIPLVNFISDVIKKIQITIRLFTLRTLEVPDFLVQI